MNHNPDVISVFHVACTALPRRRDCDRELQNHVGDTGNQATNAAPPTARVQQIPVI